MGNDRVRKPKVDKINWQLTNAKAPTVCAVMSWDDYTQLEQMFFNKGWEERRLYDEKRQVEQSKNDLDFYLRKTSGKDR